MGSVLLLPRSLAAALVACAIAAAPARAADAGPEAEAMALYAQGEEHYNAGRIDEALVAFRQAYKRLPAPGLLVNIGQCLRQLGDHENAIRAGAGGVTTKSLTVEPREGYPIPRIIKYEYGILNAVGIRNPGIKKGKELLRQFINKHDLPIIVSVFATNGKDFETLVEEISQINPQFIELNLSCPHLTSEFGLPIGSGPEAAVIAVMSAKKHANKIPVIAKLTPNIPDIASIAKACEYAGADAICAINTVGSGMVIDVNKKKPVLGNKR